MTYFLCGVVVGLFVSFIISIFCDDSLPARIAISSDGGKNPRFRWSLQTWGGKTVANCAGSFADECDARTAARYARRMMRGAK